MVKPTPGFIAYTEQDKEGTWWVHSPVFPPSVHKAVDKDDAEYLTMVINAAYTRGWDECTGMIRGSFNSFLELMGVKTDA